MPFQEFQCLVQRYSFIKASLEKHHFNVFLQLNLKTTYPSGHSVQVVCELGSLRVSGDANASCGRQKSFAGYGIALHNSRNCASCGRLCHNSPPEAREFFATE